MSPCRTYILPACGNRWREVGSASTNGGKCRRSYQNRKGIAVQGDRYSHNSRFQHGIYVIYDGLQRRMFTNILEE